MRISVAGKQIELSDVLRTRVIVHLDMIADRYFDDAVEASANFGQAQSFVTCDIDVRAMRGLVVHGEGEAADAPGAFDDAVEHIARRLRRYGVRMNDPARDQANRQLPEIGRQYILSQDDKDGCGPMIGLSPPAPAAYATIIAKHETQIETLSVGEAVMQLDLADRVVLMFRNSASYGINVVYRRPDGHIGWLDPDTPQR